jgi:glycosyltransferase involved in cell wall biosynthesis
LLGWNNRFAVVHSGNIGFAYDFDALLSAAQLLAGQPDILLVIVGDGVRKRELVERAAAQQIGNLQFLPYQPEADLPRLRAAAQLQLSLYRRGSGQLSLPSKLYETMAAARPVIASAEPDSDIAQLLQQSGAGLLVEPENPQQLAHAILALRSDPALCESMGTRGRAYVAQHHSLEGAVAAYEALLTATLT